jgi:hypothetical protein
LTLPLNSLPFPEVIVTVDFTVLTAPAAGMADRTAAATATASTNANLFIPSLL